MISLKIMVSLKVGSQMVRLLREYYIIHSTLKILTFEKEVKKTDIN